MKNIYLLVSFVIATTLCAQNAATKKADKLFNRYQYVAAAEEYLKVVDKDKADGIFCGNKPYSDWQIQ